MPIDASLTPRRCALLVVAILCILCLIVASFLSDLRLDASQSSGDYEASWLTETATGAAEESESKRGFDENDAGPNPGYYMKHLHWFVQVRGFLNIFGVDKYSTDRIVHSRHYGQS